MKTMTSGSRRPFNAIWLSDIHLGTRGCRAEFLLDFLDKNPAKVVYLVGDIVDLASLKKQFLWPDSHQAVLRRLLDMAAGGGRIVYIPGNHDHHCRDFHGQRLLGIEIHREAVHKTAAGKRFLVTHGDEFEHAVLCGQLHKLAGDLGYNALLYLNRWGNRVRSWLNLPYWSLAYYIKNRVGNARSAIHAFEQAAAREARSRGLDGIICGHIHQPEIRTVDGVLYCNDGDWVESCTALVEHNSGRLELFHWGDLQQPLKCERAANDDSSTPMKLPALIT